MNKLNELLLHFNKRLAAHIRLKSLGYPDGAVLVEIILKKSNKHSRGSGNCVVEGVSEILLAALALDSDAETSCLSVA